MKPTTRATLNGLLILGVVLRSLVLVTASPFDADAHFAVIQYIAQRVALPVSNLLQESFQPPLYYVLMAPLYFWWNSPLPIHLLSFAISTANLFLIRRLVDSALVIGPSAGRVIAFAFVCFTPQIVMFGSFISNDTLAMLVGTIVFAAVIRYVDRPSGARRNWLAASIGIGLLTKGTFLLIGPAMTTVVAVVERRKSSNRAATVVAGFCLIWAVTGCFKYVDNFVRVGKPLVSNLDVDSQFKRDQSGTWKGWNSVYDVNIVKLIRHPVLRKNSTFSYPLLMYGTFWYSHIPSESSFDGNAGGYQWIGSLIYSVAVIPTAIFLIGVVRAAAMLIARIFASQRPNDERALLIFTAALAILLANVSVIVAAGIKYDVWSCFQARLCFPSILPAITLFGLGMATVARWRWATRIAEVFCWTTILFGLLYFCVEISLAHN